MRISLIDLKSPENCTVISYLSKTVGFECKWLGNVDMLLTCICMQNVKKYTMCFKSYEHSH